MDPILLNFFLEDDDDTEFDKVLETTTLPKSLMSNDDLIYKHIKTACLDLAIGIEDIKEHRPFLSNELQKMSEKHSKCRFSKASMMLDEHEKDFIDSELDDEDIKKLIQVQKKKKSGLNRYTPNPREKVMKLRMANQFEDKTEEEFFHYLRVTRKTFSFLLEKLKDAGLFFETYSGFNFPVQAEQALQMFLYYMGQRCTYKFLSQMYSVSESAIMTSFMKCVEGINRLDGSELRWPSESEEVKAIEQDFVSIAGLPGIIGSFGGCCIEMRTNKEPPAGYKIGKLRSIMYLLAVVDSHYRFTYVQAGFPGTFCLQEAFESSSLGKMMKLSSSTLFNDEQTYLVGDSSLVLNNHLMVPYENNGALNCPQDIFNKKLLASNISKHAFALLRSRFAIFLAQIYGNLEKIPNIIKACCIIHNISLRDEEDKLYLEKHFVDNFEDYSIFRDESDFTPIQPDSEAIKRRDQIALKL